MSGNWITQIQAELCKKFPATKDYKTSDFKQSPMPVSVGHFLEHALSRRAATIQVSIDDDWFDVSDPSVVERERLWREALTASARYPAALWEQSVNQAVSLVVSFMVTPADSFCDFAFAGAERGVHPRTVLNRLAYFKPYPGLREIVRGYIDGRGSEHLEPVDLRAAILKADRAFVAEFRPSDWIAILKPLFEIAEVTCAPGQEAEIPMDVLKRVFEAKGADEIVRRLEAIESIGGRRMLSEVALLKAIGPTEIQEPVAEPEAAAPTPSSEAAGPLQRNDVHAEPGPTAVPRWMQFAAKVEPRPPSDESGDGGTAVARPEPTVAVPQSTMAVQTPATAPESAAAPPAPAAAPPAPMQKSIEEMAPSKVGERARTPDDPVAAHSNPSAAPLTESDLNPAEQRVFGQISVSRRSQFVQELFSGSDAEFSRIVSMLDTAGDWETAAHMIGSEVFERHQVDIYSEAAIEFTNLVESRFE